MFISLSEPYLMEFTLRCNKFTAAFDCLTEIVFTMLQRLSSNLQKNKPNYFSDFGIAYNRVNLYFHLDYNDFYRTKQHLSFRAFEFISGEYCVNFLTKHCFQFSVMLNISA